jgi:hypothetical protein
MGQVEDSGRWKLQSFRFLVNLGTAVVETGSELACLRNRYVDNHSVALQWGIFEPIIFIQELNNSLDDRSCTTWAG